MIVLYGDMQSRANRCAWMLKELAIAFEHVPTGFTNGDTRTPDFLQINPNGRVPVLVDGDLVLFESLAINLYLARKFGGPIASQTAREDALATQWSFWVLSEIEKPLLLAAANLKFFGAGKSDPGEVRIAMVKLARPWGVLEKQLSGQPYVLGDRFTVADLNIAGVMTLAISAGLDLDAWPHVKTWLHDCLYRPAATDWRTVDFLIPRPADARGMLVMFL